MQCGYSRGNVAIRRMTFRIAAASGRRPLGAGRIRPEPHRRTLPMRTAANCGAGPGLAGGTSMARELAHAAPVALFFLAGAGCGDILHATNWETACDLDPRSAVCGGDDSGSASTSGGDTSLGGASSASTGDAGGRSGGGGDLAASAGGVAGAGGGMAGSPGSTCADMGDAVPGYTLCEETGAVCVFSFQDGPEWTCDLLCAMSGGACVTGWKTPQCGGNNEPATCDAPQQGGACTCSKP